ncbi:uncharacterized protein K452DRAFT_18121 [Aplosporella prunicola CBS 121167]|uniref:Uncharacterized protein n=1 Tax=Aplosporella prunicola CBS 121167 TaxID=1176127 RepID=A0A6A6BHT8_9PEZI|nr:uncharacterized protein K452DRAFT_18121 [Aplosporella prunicola CBS 121167]KAF2142407.1 hypothetical protein K452DRAFT_18121 [Aplosporella prunicola CBS 121167]
MHSASPRGEYSCISTGVRTKPGQETCPTLHAVKPRQDKTPPLPSPPTQHKQATAPAAHDEEEEEEEERSPHRKPPAATPPPRPTNVLCAALKPTILICRPRCFQLCHHTLHQLTPTRTAITSSSSSSIASTPTASPSIPNKLATHAASHSRPTPVRHGMRI